MAIGPQRPVQSRRVCSFPKREQDGRAYYTIEAFCPATGGTRTLRIPHEIVEKLVKYGPAHLLFELRGDGVPTMEGSSVQQVLTNPTAVFAGVREHQQGGLCYSGRPLQRWTMGGAKVPPPPGMVFLVFVNPLDCVYAWRWELADEADPACPEGFQTRFVEGMIWARR